MREETNSKWALLWDSEPREQFANLLLPEESQGIATRWGSPQQALRLVRKQLEGRFSACKYHIPLATVKRIYRLTSNHHCPKEKKAKSWAQKSQYHLPKQFLSTLGTNVPSPERASTETPPSLLPMLWLTLRAKAFFRLLHGATKRDYDSLTSGVCSRALWLSHNAWHGAFSTISLPGTQ